MESETKTNVHSKKKIVGTVALVVVAVAALAIIYKPNQKINDLTSKNTAQAATVKTLASSQTDLKKANDNLTKSYNALKSTPAVASAKSTAVSPTTPQAVASLKINSVQVLPNSYFGSTNAYASETSRSINVTMNNLSGAKVNFNVTQFTGITATGEIVHARVYTNDPGNGTFWNNTDVAAGGNITEYIPFDPAKSIVTLEWTPAGSAPIDLPIPADQN